MQQHSQTVRMMPVLNRLLLYGLVGGTDYRDLGIGLSVINGQQMVHIPQGNNKLNGVADHLDFSDSVRLHPHLLAGNQCAVCTFWDRKAPCSVIGSAC